MVVVGVLSPTALSPAVPLMKRKTPLEKAMLPVEVAVCGS